MSDDKFTIAERLSNIANYLQGNSHRTVPDRPWPEPYDNRGWDDICSDKNLSTLDEAAERAEKK